MEQHFIHHISSHKLHHLSVSAAVHQFGLFSQCRATADLCSRGGLTFGGVYFLELLSVVLWVVELFQTEGLRTCFSQWEEF